MWNRISGAFGLLWLALGSCVSLPLSSQNSSAAQSAVEREFQAAMTAQQNGDLDGAKTLLLKLRREHPGIFPVDESLGLIYAAQEEFSEALPILQAAVREAPSSDAAHANLGAALFKLHRNHEALAEFEQAVRLNPGSFQAQQSLGELWLDSGKPERAAEAFSSALRLKPGDDELTFSYAAALLAGKHYGEAAQALSAATTADQSALAQSLLGEIDEAKGRSESAGKHFARAVELEPSEANLWMLGVEFLRHWTFEAAIREFEAGAAKYPSSTRIKLGLATAYFGDAKYEEAIPVFAGLLSSDKDNPLYAEMLGMACTAATSGGKGQCSTLVEYVLAHPRDGRAAMYAASLLLTENSTDAQSALGTKLLEQAVAADPKLPDAQCLMGVTKQNAGDWPGSVPYLQKAISLKPDLAQAHYRLALAYWRTGHKEEAQGEMDLQKRYAQQERQDLDRRLRQITTFVVDMRD